MLFFPSNDYIHIVSYVSLTGIGRRASEDNLSEAEMVGVKKIFR
ncbi:MAG TPA: hypothetical protein VJK01_03380 [Candidatus Paceibacterota bacterium]